MVKKTRKAIKRNISPSYSMTTPKVNKLKAKGKNSIESILTKNMNCENITSLVNTVKVIKTLGQGSTGHSIQLCNDNNCEYPIAAKFSKVSTKLKFDQKHPVKVEMKIQKIVNKLVQDQISPHFNQTYGESIICNSNELNKIDHFVTYFKEFKEGNLSSSQKKNIFEGIKKVVVSFMELGESDLFEYLLVNSKKISLMEMKSIIFQVYYSLMVLQYHEPGFKHLDLKTDNILVFNPDPKKTKGKYNKYVIDNREYYLPADGIQIKIFDFDFAVSDKIENSKISCDMFGKIGLSKDHNPVQDCHYFLNFLLNFRTEYFHYKKPVLDFIKLLLPERLSGRDKNKVIVKYRLSNYNNLSGLLNCNYVPPKGEMLTPAEALIESDHFKEFLKVPVNKNIGAVFDSKLNPESAKSRSDMFIIN
jgi:serine/threonine protein kinase